ACRSRQTGSRLAVSSNSACFAMLHSRRWRTTRMLKTTFTGFLPFRVLSQKPGVHSMRQVLLAGLSVVGLVAITAPTASAATDYRYCLQGGDWGYPGNCEFSTYSQCMLSASGMAGS